MKIAGPTTNQYEIQRWAERSGMVPVELLPHLLDSEPGILRFVKAEPADANPNMRTLAWEEFFLKFDTLRLMFVYDEGGTGYNEILHTVGESSRRYPAYCVQALIH